MTPAKLLQPTKKNKHVDHVWIDMVGHSFTFFNLADLSETARIEPGPLGWHKISLTTEVHEVRQ